MDTELIALEPLVATHTALPERQVSMESAYWTASASDPHLTWLLVCIFEIMQVGSISSSLCR